MRLAGGHIHRLRLDVLHAGKSGAGVMLDDLAAAIYANIALRFVAHLIV